MVEVLLLLVTIALLEVILQTCSLQHSALKTAVSLRKALAVNIVVVIRTVVRHVEVGDGASDK